MVVGVCATCTELFDRGRLCPRCGSKLATSRAALLAWADARERSRIAAWQEDGVIDAAIAARLLEEEKRDADEAEPPAATRSSAVERGADGVVTGAGDLYREMSERWTRLARTIEEDRAPASERIEPGAMHRDERTLDAGRAIFARDGSAVVGAPR